MAEWRGKTPSVVVTCWGTRLIEAGDRLVLFRSSIDIRGVTFPLGVMVSDAGRPDPRDGSRRKCWRGRMV